MRQCPDVAVDPAFDAPWLVVKLSDISTAWPSISMRGFVVAAGHRDLRHPARTRERVMRSMGLPVAFALLAYVLIELLDLIVEQRAPDGESASAQSPLSIAAHLRWPLYVDVECNRRSHACTLHF